MASTVAPISDVRPGYVVATGHEAIGEVEDILEAGHVTYLSVRCNALGLDELFIPSHAIERVVGNHVYLVLNRLDLLAEPWHVRPAGAIPRTDRKTAGLRSG